jgi:NitT/TauT family transport system permease protein
MRSRRGLLTLAILLGLAEAALRFFAVPDYIMPTPSAIFLALVAGFRAPFASPAGFYIHILTTLYEALAAFGFGSAAGVAIGAAMVEFPPLRRHFLPYLIGLQSVPKVALAPLFVVWFGLGLAPKIALGMLLTFFPLLINTVAGLSGVETERIDLLQSLHASRWKIFCYVRFPSALPFIFAGLEMAAVYAVLAAVVGEFVGGDTGLGVLILSRNAALDIPGALAALVLLALMGILLQRLVTLARARVLFWLPMSHNPG